jgi:hypothetical protein
MSFDTYAALQAEVARWIRRDDLTDDIPGFITLAEAQMNQRLRVPEMMTNAAQSITAETLALPTDFLAVKSFRLTSGSGRELKFITEEQAQSYKATPSQIPAEPRTYTRRGSYFEFTPTPDQTYTGSLTYYAKIPALTDSATSNWVLADFPHAYLYGALMQSAPFLKADVRMATWGPLFEAALDDIRTANRAVQSPALTVDGGLGVRREGFNIMSGDY